MITQTRAHQGQLGDGTWGLAELAYSSTPIAVRAGQAFTAIGAGDGFTCALTSGGEAWCWGNYSQAGMP